MNERDIAQLQKANTTTFVPVHSDLLQRKCACGQHTIAGGECAQCRKKRLGLQRQAIGQAGPMTAPPIVNEVLRSPGQPLDAKTRTFMEPRFGHDFSQVRVHTGAKAVESAQAVNALAYTVAQNVVFGAGQYAPLASEGRRLLAHELTHVVQQQVTGGRPQAKLTINPPGDAAEREANIQAARIISDSNATPVKECNAVPVLQRIGDLTKVPPGMSCPVAMDSPASVVDKLEFGNAVSALTAAQKAQIEAFVVSWRALGGSTDVRVDGYASKPGTDEFNWQLSCDRAEAVKSELLSPSSGTVPGIPASHITIFAQGETDEFSSLGAGTDRRASISSPAPLPPPLPPPPPPAVPSCKTPTNPDRHGRAFNPTTDGETWVCVTNPVDCDDAFDCRDTAFSAARASGLPGPHLGPQDAFRHCVWSCCMAQEMGSSEAEKFGTAHENSNPSSIPFDNRMDLHNNAIGRSLGTTSADCEAECRSAVTSGRLRTIRGPHTRPPSPVTTTCIGASDQSWP